MFGFRKIIVLIPVIGIFLTAGILLGDDIKDDEDIQTLPPVEEKSQSLTEWENLYAGIEQAVNTTIDSGFQRVKPILEKSCFDCHSQNTDFPWYASIPGIKGMLNDHVAEGREELDMTDGFPFKGKNQPIKLLKKMREEIEAGKMPLFSYRVMHWGTLIEGAERDTVFAWLDSAVVRLERLGR